MADLKKEPSSIACYKGKYYEVWQYKADNDRMKTSIDQAFAQSPYLKKTSTK